MIVRLNGGLGNQLFQYAFGVSVGLARTEPVYFHKFGLDSGPRAYSLGVFNTNPTFKDPDAGTPQYGEKTFAFDKSVLDAPPGSYFIGCWQTERYFVNKLIRPALTPKNPLTQETVEWKMKIVNSKQPTCSIHVRRTDYLVPSTVAYHGSMGMEYYNAAIEHIKSRVANVRFYVFSDDTAWCRENFVGEEFSIIAANGMGNGNAGPSTEHEDLFLMGFCDHAIIPNSSFGWWGAWLGDQNSKDYKTDRTVIAPQNWFNPTGPVKHFDTSDVCPARWTRL